MSADADVSLANDWVRENVLPHIDFTLSKRRRLIRDEILAFMMVPRGGKPEIWGYFSSYDGSSSASSSGG